MAGPRILRQKSMGDIQGRACTSVGRTLAQEPRWLDMMGRGSAKPWRLLDAEKEGLFFLGNRGGY